jgi:phosphohistidine swiveling domain-containing protein
MKLILAFEEIRDNDRGLVGGKAFALSRMARTGMNVPPGLCVTTEAYNDFVSSTGLQGRICMEWGRKRFEDMRWEEMWDLSLRIRNIFLNTPMSAQLANALSGPIASTLTGKRVVVRSSAPHEDSARASFAGLHESYVNIEGMDAIIERIKLVWASLWSDRAMLYRQELGLDVEKSAMAVVIQEIVVGERSGVIFGRNPNDASQAVIEAVYGLNQGLVDGTVEPDKWILDRKTGRIISHFTAQREKAMATSHDGVSLQPLLPEASQRPPLTPEETGKVYELAKTAETIFGAPQDMEWTLRQNTLYVLQSRPITTGPVDQKDDQRPWYLSLHRSFENLKTLRRKIEDELLPQMKDEALRLANQELAKLSDAELAEEIGRRTRIYDQWSGIYREHFIPMAHGMRLFGEFYNSAMHPSDPYEFMSLLGASEMVSIKRNRMLEGMASMIRQDEKLAAQLTSGESGRLPEAFDTALEAFIDQFGDLSCGAEQCTQGRDSMINLLLEMATYRPPTERFQRQDFEALKQEFLTQFSGGKKDYATELLDLGQASYRLRDDDNIYIGRIKGQVSRAADEGRGRIEQRGGIHTKDLEAAEIIRALEDPNFVPERPVRPDKDNAKANFKARQLVGQPACPGIARGRAKVILAPSDLMSFEAGEVFVCDALDPTMTFVVPLAAGIVERRGGMLIHGAIIAREYGLPCVTGVPKVTSFIRTGDQITVDGYLGIVIVSSVS